MRKETVWRYFSFSVPGGFELHETLEEARARAQGELDCERDAAPDDGWNEDDVGQICYGEVRGMVFETCRMPWLDHLRQQGTPEEDLPTNPRFDEFVDFDLCEVVPSPREVAAEVERGEE